MLKKEVKYFFKRLISKLLPDEFFNTYQFIKYHRRLPSRVRIGMSDYIHYLKSIPEIASYGPYIDKLLVKKRVAELIGKEHIIKNYWSGSQLTQEIWEHLPPSFMIKASHGSGWNYLVIDKSKENFEKVKRITARWMKKNYYYVQRERAYINIRPSLMVEEYIGELGRPATDYKFHCIAGKTIFILVVLDRGAIQKDILYDRNWNKLEIKTPKPNNASVEKPTRLEQMIGIAETLAKDFDFVRVDLYLHDDQIYFGEYTFTPAAGFIKFSPATYDQELGSILESELGEPLAFSGFKSHKVRLDTDQL